MHQEMITFIEMFVGSVELWKHCPKHIHGSSGIIVVIVVKSMWGGRTTMTKLKGW
jgi:hypothetical protein